MYNKNAEKLIKKLGWSLEDLENGMNAISETSKRIIEIRLGLIGNAKACHSYEQLNQKLGIKNSKKAYERAIRELKNWEFAKAIVDAEKFPNKQQVINLGKLAKDIFASPAEHSTIIGQALLLTIETTLISREKIVIQMRYGLESPYVSMTIEEVAKKFNLTHERMRQIEVRALRKLRHPSRMRQFYTVAKAKYEEYLKAKTAESRLMEGFSESDDIEILNLSVRTFICLRKAGIRDLKAFLSLTEKDAKEIKNLGRHGVEEIDRVRLSIGVPLK